MPHDEPAGAPLADLSFHVLITLAGGEAHGYAIGREVEARSHGRLRPTTGALYQALRRLQEDGLIAPSPSPAETTDARRRYYRITERGRNAATAEASRLQELVDAARASKLYAS